MKRFACGDVVPGCPATFHAVDETEILTAVAAHAASSHGIDALDAELIALIEGHISNA